MAQAADGTLYGSPTDVITITCTVANSESIEVYWYKDGSQITNDFTETIDGTVVTSEYAISSLSSSDEVYIPVVSIPMEKPKFRSKPLHYRQIRYLGIRELNTLILVIPLHSPAL